VSTNTYERAEAVIEKESISIFLSHLACQLKMSHAAGEVAWAEPIKKLLRDEGCGETLSKVERDYR
jgi:hypothetical protein